MRMTLPCAVILGAILAVNVARGWTQELPSPAEFRHTPQALQLPTKQ